MEVDWYKEPDITLCLLMMLDMSTFIFTIGAHGSLAMTCRCNPLRRQHSQFVDFLSRPLGHALLSLAVCKTSHYEVIRLIGSCRTTVQPLSSMTPSSEAYMHEVPGRGTERRLLTYPESLIPRLQQRVLRRRIRDIERARHVRADQSRRFLWFRLVSCGVDRTGLDPPHRRSTRRDMRSKSECEAGTSGKSQIVLSEQGFW